MMSADISSVVSALKDFLLGDVALTVTTFMSVIVAFGLTRASEVRRENISRSSKSEPRPKWEILRMANYFFLFLFILSLASLLNSRPTASSPAYSLAFFVGLLGATLSLAYIFGFFGISLIGDEDAAVFSGDGAEDPSRAERPHCPPSSTARPPCSPSPAPPADVTCISDTAQEQSREEEEDDHILGLLLAGELPAHALERRLGPQQLTRAVRLRRRYAAVCMAAANREAKDEDKDEDKGEGEGALSGLPCEQFDYSSVLGTNCELVIGYVPVPVGMVWPLLLNGRRYCVPMATTEGCLVASTNRGAKAITRSGGCSAMVLRHAMSRAPCVQFPSVLRASVLVQWLATGALQDRTQQQQQQQLEPGLVQLQRAFGSTTSVGRLEAVEPTLSGRYCYLRFSAHCGDAMGMNMVSKGVSCCLELLSSLFPDMTVVSISGNACADKKSAAVNWVRGRGCSVVAEAVISREQVQTTLKIDVETLVEVNTKKNLMGSAVAGALGGFNAHAANMVAALFIALGQDPAQVVESSSCITFLEPFYAEGKEEGAAPDLYISVSLPSLEVGTVGGGTHLAAQAACLRMLGVAGRSLSPSPPGTHSRELACIVAGTVLAGELSLLAALGANHLVASHMKYNRPAPPQPASQPLPETADQPKK